MPDQWLSLCVLSWLGDPAADWMPRSHAERSPSISMAWREMTAREQYDRFDHANAADIIAAEVNV
ncbi:hypothetical protein ACGFNP_24185 [Nonomuraea sp. NPDC049269]|uniref:hypothetical protein n=1 Tax=Nonomuraea sp. NPDC049269 TaxID=3364349 RepID=UPI00371FDC54